MTDPALEYEVAIAEPCKILRRLGVQMPHYRFSPALDPRLWRYNAIYVVAQCLIDNGLLDPASLRHERTGRLVAPARWRFRWRSQNRTTRGRLYDWFQKEWRAAPFPIVEAQRWFDDLTAEAPPDDYVTFARSLVDVRNVLARMAGLAPSEHRPEFPALQDYVFALDQAIDRLQDAVRRAMLRRLFAGRGSDAERAEAVALLQAEIDAGRWETAIRDLNEEWGPPDPIPLHGWRGRQRDVH